MRKQTDYPLGMFEVKESFYGSNDTFQIYVCLKHPCLKIKRSGYEHPAKQNLISTYQYTMLYDADVQEYDNFMNDDLRTNIFEQIMY